MEPTSPFFNLVIGLIGLILGVAFGFAWKKSKGTVESLLETIKSKPKVAIDPSFMHIGALEQQIKTEQ